VNESRSSKLYGTTGLATDDARSEAAVNPAAVRRFAVRRLTLGDFRNYAELRLEPEADMLVFTGANGAGKTNLLEAVSLLVPGRGLRRPRLGELARHETPAGLSDVGTGMAPAENDGASERRTVRIDGETARSQAALADVMSAHWLTPQMDRLFQEGASARRRFLDRMVFGWDAAHAGRVAAYEQAMRQRLKLLRGTRAPDTSWLAALEETMAAKGIAVAAARLDVVGRLASAAAEGWGPFPGADIELQGDLEGWLVGGPALAAEDRFRDALAGGRGEDARTGRTASGPHRSDLCVRHRPKDQDAALCSTGEQKALLIGLVLANARTRAAAEGGVPVLLLDEVAAHLDESRRSALYEALTGLGGQVWLTGTEIDLFRPLGGRAEFYSVADGGVERLR
jgi:DNA replication and repair protein RecF